MLTVAEVFLHGLFHSAAEGAAAAANKLANPDLTYMTKYMDYWPIPRRSACGEIINFTPDYFKNMQRLDLLHHQSGVPSTRVPC